MTKLIDFSKIRHKNVEYFYLVHAHYPLSVSNIFLALFLSFCSVLQLVLPLSFHILSGSPKKLSVNYGQTLGMGP